MATPILQQIRDRFMHRPTLRRPALRYAVRVMVAGFLAYSVAISLALPQGFWAVITAIVVMQSTVGASLKAALDRLTGTLLGAAVGFCVSILHFQGYAAGIALALALLPVAYAASINPSFRVAPVTTAIMLIGTGNVSLDPVAAAVDRVLEIGVGSVIGLLVALVVLPARAERALALQLAELLRLFSEALAINGAALTGTGSRAGMEKINVTIRQKIAAADNHAEEARHERTAYLADGTEAGPLLRTTRRLRTNLLLIGRSASEPWPEAARAALTPATTELFEKLSSHLRDLADAMERRIHVQPTEGLAEAFDAFDAAIAYFRRAPESNDVAPDALARVFTLAFAVDQFRRDTRDLADRLNELAGEPAFLQS